MPSWNHSINRARIPGYVLSCLILSSLVGCGPTPEELLTDARQQVADRDMATASISLKNLLQAEPQNIEARWLLAEASLALGDAEAAKKELGRARDLGAPIGDILPDLIRVKLVLGEHVEVMEILTSEEFVPHFSAVDLAQFRGEAQLGLGDPEAASNSFDLAIQNNPADPRAYWGRASALMMQGDAVQARAVLDYLTDNHADFAKGWLLRGQLAMAIGEYQSAGSDFRIAEQLASALPDRMLQLASLHGLVDALLSVNELDEAEEHLGRLSRISGGAPGTRFLIARLAMAREDYRAASLLLEGVLSDNPGDIAAEYLYGTALIAEGAYAQAEAILSQVVARAPHHLMARRLLATAQVQLSNHRSAVETITPMLDEGDSGVAVFASQAMLYAGSVQDAVRLLEASNRENPEDRDVELALAAAYLQSGDQAKAISIVEGMPEDTSSFRRGLMLALAYVEADDSAGAESQIEQVIDDAGDDAQALTLVGDYFLRQMRLGRATDLYSRAQQVDDSYLLAELGLGRVAVAAGNSENAVVHFQSVLRKDATNLESLVALAGLAIESGDHDAAVEFLLRATNASDGAVAPRMMLASLYQATGNLVRAEQYAHESARIASDNGQIQLDSGRLLASMGKHAEALPYLRSAVNLLPESDTAWFWLAQAQIASGDTLAARRSLNESLTLSPQALQPSVVLALVEISDGNLDTALSIASGLQKAHPDSAAPHSLTADVLMMQGQIANAVQHYVSAYELSPSALLARRIYQAQVEIGSADAGLILKDWVENNPEDTGSALYLAQHHMANGEQKAAIDLYVAVLESDVDNLGALNNLAWLYSEGGDARAEDLARRAYRLRPDVPSIADTLGWILIQGGNFQEGARYIEDAHNADPESPNIKYHFAYVVNERGERSASKTVLQELLAENDEFYERDNAENLYQELESR